MPSKIDLNDIRLLMLVIEHGSFTAASRAIGVPKSTISQRIGALERSLGTGLLRRTSRAFSLTEAGTLLLPHARAIEELAKKVEQALFEQGKDLCGTLRVSCCNAIGQFILPSLVSRFLAQYPDVTIRIEASNRYIDIIGEGFDLALRSHAGLLKDSNLLQRVVARAPWALVVGPEWLKLNQMPSHPTEIRGGDVIWFSMTRESPALTLLRGEEETVVQLSPRLIFDDIATLHAATLAGGGISCLPTYIVCDSLQAGRLIIVLADWSPLSATLSVLTPPKAQSSRLARTFSDFLASELPKAMLSTEIA